MKRPVSPTFADKYNDKLQIRQLNIPRFLEILKLVLIYQFTLHVILSHALEATSSITERSSVILSHALQRLRRLLSVSEESVTDASLRSA